jgi:hypothetical protein
MTWAFLSNIIGLGRRWIRSRYGRSRQIYGHDDGSRCTKAFLEGWDELLALDTRYFDVVWTGSWWMFSFWFYYSLLLRSALHI